MKVSALKYTVLTWVSMLTMLVFWLVPFHATLTIWLSSNFGHYTAFRLWKEVILVVCVVGAVYLLLTDHKIRSHTLSRRLVWVILAYMALNIIWGLLAINMNEVSAKAVGYGLIVNLRFLVFFLLCWALALRTARLRKRWQMLVLWPAAVVVAFGILQVLVLPNDFLRHFGYSEATIPAFETVNSNINYIRIASTLRGANPLGAYLIIPISVLVVLMIQKGRNWRQGIFLAATFVVLFFTYSRSAWIGALLSIIAIIFISPLSKKTRKLSYFVAGVFVSFGVLGALVLNNNSYFENLVFHTEDNSTIQVSSNNSRSAALKSGLADIKNEPLGEGPGSAGPASVYNNEPSRIAENYFLQIGQEVGIVGLILFILINAGVGLLLWLRREDPLALSLFASLIGITFVNMLSHAWTDDTLALVWWGMAGIAMVAEVRPIAKKQ